MAHVFGSSSVAVGVYPDKGVRAYLTIQGPTAWGTITESVIVSGLGCSESVAQQIDVSLAGKVNIYLFGDNPGVYQIVGSTFIGGTCSTGRNGLAALLQYYRANRISTTQLPISIVMDTITIRGYLSALSVQPSDPKTLMAPFSMTVISTEQVT